MEGQTSDEEEEELLEEMAVDPSADDDAEQNSHDEQNPDEPKTESHDVPMDEGANGADEAGKESHDAELSFSPECCVSLSLKPQAPKSEVYVLCVPVVSSACPNVSSQEGAPRAKGPHVPHVPRGVPEGEVAPGCVRCVLRQSSGPESICTVLLASRFQAPLQKEQMCVLYGCRW